MTKTIFESEVPWCGPEAKRGELCKLRVKDLAPTQFAVGRAEVEVRAGRFRKKYRRGGPSFSPFRRKPPLRSNETGARATPGAFAVKAPALPFMNRASNEASQAL